MGIFKKDCIMQKVITTFVFILFWFAAGELFAAGSASDSLAGKKPEKDDAPQLVEEFIRDDAKIVKGLTTLYFQDGKYYININSHTNHLYDYSTTYYLKNLSFLIGEKKKKSNKFDLFFSVFYLI